MSMKSHRKRTSVFAVVLLLGIIQWDFMAVSHAEQMRPEEYKVHSRITDEVIPLEQGDVLRQPRPLLELGDPLLATGPIRKGITLPTGAVWQPSLVVWGTYRTAVQDVYNGSDHVAEWANRYDLFANLYLTQTERIVLVKRLLDDPRDFTGYSIAQPSGTQNAFHNHFNLTYEPDSLFFEGDIGELLPFLDPRDRYGLDYGISVGRQVLNFQGGLLINDNVDALGISRINLKPPTANNWRIAFVWGWNELNRRNLPKESDAQLLGLFHEVEWRESTVEADLVYVMDRDTNTGEGLYTGIGATQRLGGINTTFRLVNSEPFGSHTVHNDSGFILFTQLSWTPHASENLVYANGFKGINDFRSASRDPGAGGPLGQVGILFESAGMGRYGAPINNTADDAIGGALGYQMFFDHTRTQLVLEVGGRYAANDLGQRAAGGVARYQVAIGKHMILRLDGYTVYDDNRASATTKKDQFRYGSRLEVVWKS